MGVRLCHSCRGFHHGQQIITLLQGLASSNCAKARIFSITGHIPATIDMQQDARKEMPGL